MGRKEDRRAERRQLRIRRVQQTVKTIAGISLSAIIKAVARVAGAHAPTQRQATNASCGIPQSTLAYALDRTTEQHELDWQPQHVEASAYKLYSPSSRAVVSRSTSAGRI